MSANKGKSKGNGALTLSGSPIIIDGLTPLKRRIIAALEKVSDNELLTAKDVAKLVGTTTGSVMGSAMGQAFLPYAETISTRGTDLAETGANRVRVYGNPRTIEKARRLRE